MKRLNINLVKVRQLIFIYFSVSLLIALGPNFQHYFFSIIYSSSSSIYDNAFEGELIHFPSLIDWIKSIGSIPVILVSTVISLTILGVKSPIENAKRSGWACFICWCVIDLFTGVINGQNLDFFLKCFVANLLGSVVFSFLLIMLFEIISIYINNSRKNYQVDLFFGEMILLFSSFILFCCVYYFLTFLFNPLPFNIKITSGYPAEGFLMADENETSDVKNFLLPNRLISSEISMTSIGEDFDINFDSNADNYTYNVRVAFFKDCVFVDEALESVSSSSWNEYGNVSSLHLNVSAGVTDFSSSLNRKSFLNIVNDDQLSQYWLDLSDNKESLEIGQYFQNLSLDYESYPDSQYFFLSAYLFDKRDDAVIPNSRRVRLSLDQREYFYDFEPSEDLSYEDELVCQPIELDIDNKRSNNSNEIDSLVSGVLLSISPNFDNGITRFYEKTMFSLRGGDGFRNISGLDLSDLKYNKVDKVGFLSIDGNLESVVINNVEKNVYSSDVYTAIGDFRLRYNDNGSVFIEGVADFLWNRKQRVNQTRWEISGIGWGEIITLVSGFLLLIYYVLRKLLLPRLSINKEYDWKVV